MFLVITLLCFPFLSSDLLLSLIVIIFQYTVAMMGYGPEANNPVLELTYNYGITNYDKGNGYGQVDSILFLFSEEDFYDFCMVLHDFLLYVIVRMQLILCLNRLQ